MSKSKLILIIVAIVIVIIVVVGVILNLPKGEKEEGEQGTIKKPPEGSSEERGEVVLPEPEWQRPEKPVSSPPLEEEEIPEKAVKIGVSAAGFSPASFEVKKGAKVILSVISQDEGTHVFKFGAPALAEVVIGMASGETRVITFYAPKEAGEYEFYCDIPGHAGRGERGKMIVE